MACLLMHSRRVFPVKLRVQRSRRLGLTKLEELWVTIIVWRAHGEDAL